MGIVNSSCVNMDSPVANHNLMEVNQMLTFIVVLITLYFLKKCGVYNKEIGRSSIKVSHLVMIGIYIILFCMCPIFALVLFLIFDAKKLFNKLKIMKKEVV